MEIKRRAFCFEGLKLIGMSVSANTLLSTSYSHAADTISTDHNIDILTKYDKPGSEHLTMLYAERYRVEAAKLEFYNIKFKNDDNIQVIASYLGDSIDSTGPFEKKWQLIRAIIPNNLFLDRNYDVGMVLKLKHYIKVYDSLRKTNEYKSLEESKKNYRKSYREIIDLFGKEPVFKLKKLPKHYISEFKNLVIGDLTDNTKNIDLLSASKIFINVEKNNMLLYKIGDQAYVNKLVDRSFEFLDQHCDYKIKCTIFRDKLINAQLAYLEKYIMKANEY